MIHLKYTIECNRMNVDSIVTTIIIIVRRKCKAITCECTNSKQQKFYRFEMSYVSIMQTVSTTFYCQTKKISILSRIQQCLQ